MGCRKQHFPPSRQYNLWLLPDYSLTILKYYHRNAACEFLGLIYGTYPGRSDDFLPGMCCALIISRLRNELIHIIGGASFETGFCPHGGVYDPFPLSHGPSFNFDNSWLWSLECCIKYGLSSWKDIQGQFEWALPSVCLINGGTDIPTLLQWSCLSLACPSLLPTMPWIVVVSNMVCLAMMFCRAA